MKGSTSIYHILLKFLSATLTVHAISCPFKSNDSQCKCSPPVEDMTITCENVNTDEFLLLMDKLRNFKHLPAAHLEIIKSNLTEITSDIFRRLGFRSIHFEKCMLSLGTAQLFAGVESKLEDLQFRWCEIRFLSPNWTLGSLPKLQRLAFTYSLLPSLPGSFLNTPANHLQSIYFYGNGIQQIEKGALLTVFSLKVLCLNNNRIKSLNRAMLPRPTTDLIEIHLRKNEIEHLPHSMWEDMLSLKLVDISFNYLHVLQEEIWSPVWSSLTDIYLQGNPLHCDCNVRWLTQEESKMNKSKKSTRIFYGLCSSPVYLRNKALEKLTIFDLPC